MAEAVLVNHRGGHEVTERELSLIRAPPPTDTWFPVDHSIVLNTVKDTLAAAGFGIAKQRLSISYEGQRFFGTLDLTSLITDGIALAVGIRSSTDKSFPIGWCAGARCFVCDNLSFHADVVISKKHTRFGQERYREGIALAVSELSQYQTSAAAWIDRLRSWQVSRQEADSIILQSYEEELIGPRLLPEVIKQWREPQYEEYRPRTGWSLWNAFTAALRSRQETMPALVALTTIKLQRLFSPEVIDGSATAA